MDLETWQEPSTGRTLEVSEEKVMQHSATGSQERASNLDNNFHCLLLVSHVKQYFLIKLPQSQVCEHDCLPEPVWAHKTDISSILILTSSETKLLWQLSI